MKITLENLTMFKIQQWEIIIGFCALILAYVIGTAITKAKKHFPPGPIGLPLVGYLPFLTKDIHLNLMQLGKKYGDIFRVKLGSKYIVILHGADAVIEAFSKPEFLGRPPNNTFEKTNPSSAICGSNISLWKEQRIFLMQSLKVLGFCKEQIEKNLMNEINDFMNFLRNTKAQPVDIKKPLCASTSNSIGYLIFGKRFGYDDPTRQFLEKNLEDYTRAFTAIGLDILFPWIRYIPFTSKFLRSNQSRNAMKNYENFLMGELNEHLKSFNPDHLRDFIDEYLIEMHKRREKNPDTSFDHNMLINNARDLFIAGSESVGSSLLWLIYIIAAFPDVQKKVQKEIIEVIGLNKTPEYRSMRNMPYTRAVIMETMRWKTVAAVSLMHCTLAETSVGGYVLPKGTTVIANLWAVHHDTRYWDEPEKFNPERFLSKDRYSVVKSCYLMPFLIGKRSCPGKSLAYLEFFLYLISILQEFDVALPEETEPSFEGKLIFSYRPKPYLVRFIPKK